MTTEAKINEIFSSVQGEGTVVGFKQLFIRFCGCNLKCDYCDTEFLDGKIYTPQSLFDEICTNYDLKSFHSISLTGGEPLLSYEFLQEFLPLIYGKTKIYLETNATMTKEFKEIKSLIDIVAADIKLPSATGIDILIKNKTFLNECNGVYAFAKIVFDKNITQNEIEFCANLAQETEIELVLQPKMIGSKISVSPEFCEQILDKFSFIYPNVRLIPQVHKFLNVR